MQPSKRLWSQRGGMGLVRRQQNDLNGKPWWSITVFYGRSDIGWIVIAVSERGMGAGTPVEFTAPCTRFSIREREGYREGVRDSCFLSVLFCFSIFI